MNENEAGLSPDDPRLTAYAFGELDEKERDAVEAAVQRDPALQQAVRELRAWGGTLSSALARESVAGAGPSPAPGPAQIAPPTSRSSRRTGGAKGARWLKFPGLYYLMTGAAAAGFALFVAWRGPAGGPSARDVVRRYEVTLIPAGHLRNEGATVRTDDPDDHPFLRAEDTPVSTFAVEVTTEAYAEVRRHVLADQSPPRAAVRIEEMVNAFPYRYEPPSPVLPSPIAAHLEVAAAPWDSRHRLVRIGLQGKESTGRVPVPLAHEVRYEVVFNPSQVAHYRLIGYEGRERRTGELEWRVAGAPGIETGYRVTALYEVILVDDKTPAPAEGRPPVSASRDRVPAVAGAEAAGQGELLTVKVHYRDPADRSARRLEFPLVDRGASFDEASADFQFAAAVAGFGLILRDSPHRGSASLSGVSRWAERASAFDPGGHRAEFIDLVRRAETLVR